MLSVKSYTLKRKFIWIGIFIEWSHIFKKTLRIKCFDSKVEQGSFFFLAKFHIWTSKRDILVIRLKRKKKEKLFTLAVSIFKLQFENNFKRGNFRRRFRLPQRSHLQTLKSFVSIKSGKSCEKSGKYWIKSGYRENLRRFIFFPVYAPDFN